MVKGESLSLEVVLQELRQLVGIATIAYGKCADN